MKMTIFYVVIAIFLLVAGRVAASKREAAAAVAKPAPSTITEDLRSLALGGTAEGFGIDTTRLPQGVWGVVMDTRYPEGLVSVVALADGSASIYLGPGSGVIGGFSHESVRVAAKSAVAEAATRIGLFSPTTDLSPPPVESTRILLLSTRGVYASASVPEESLGNGGQELSPLFYSMQSVITELRLAPQTAP